MSQPALSRIIRDLETTHSLRLFDRTGRGVRLSAAGHDFKYHAELVLREYENLIAAVDRLQGAEVGELNVSIPLRVGRLILAPLLDNFYLRFPNAAIHVYENLNLQTQEGLHSGSIDLGMFYTPPVPSGLSCDVVGREALYAFGNADLLAEGGDTITMAEVATLPLLLQAKPAHYRGVIERNFQKASLRPIVRRELETLDAHISFAIEGEGITILPYSNVWQEVETGTLIAKMIVDPMILRGVAIATNSNSTNPLVRETLKLMKQTIDSNRDQARWLKTDALP